uniref:SAM domain-containing protein n=1 Tax=Pygocentrus nattereri TaxID=42514 RepID=A0AAR2KHI6_PYGNA
MMSDASEMLAAALEQMDGIIAGSKAMDYSNGLFDCQSPTSPFLGSLRALHLLEDLRGALDLMDTEERESLRSQVPETTAESLVEWLHGKLTNGHGSAVGDLVCQERLSRLESDKECLVLQVSVLTDQVEVQGEKIKDLEMCLEEHRMKLNATEELLQQELLSRSALETQKLELLTEISSLKLKLATVERENREILCNHTTQISLQLPCQFFSNTLVSLLPGFSSCSHLSLSRSPCSLMAFGISVLHLLSFDSHPSVSNTTSSLHELLGQPDSSSQQNAFCEVPGRCALLVLQGETEEGDVKKTSPSASPSQSSPVENDSFGTRKSRSSFGRGFFKIRGGKRTASAPNLADAERKRTEHLDLAGATSPKAKEGATISPEGKKKVKGIRKFLGMMRKSHSTSYNLDDASESEFKRGGVRATAGPRLGWSRDLQRGNNNELDTPFAHWSKEQVCVWLQEQGLGLYLSQAQQWIRSGQTLLSASQHDLEKDLGIRHPLHRKKLQLALQTLGSEEDDAKGKLDFNWVTRWLDDIGLPQYKSQFDEGRVDGRMLHYMSVDDLLYLKVGSVLHHLSIKRAIQVLRINRYEPNCLRRRPSDENNITPAEVCEWTNHRVMEWLRSVDLAEYAPNLRGSGVHGGLMVLEPRFNVETMALLLNIPSNKTLLRRHLATHFHLLIGAEAQRLKQECLENPDYTLLTATAKVKPRRLSFGGFGTLRRKRQEDSEEYVCPMDVQMPQSSSFHRGLRMYEDELDQLEQMEDSEGTVRQIGAFSEGINNLTVRYQANHAHTLELTILFYSWFI